MNYATNFERLEIQMLRIGKSQNKSKNLLTMVILSAGILVLACNFSAQLIQDAHPVTPTQLSKVKLGNIQGYIWNDLCESAIEGNKLRPGCVLHAGTGRIYANGIFGPEEEGISNIQVSLGKGICPSRGLESVESGEGGFYRFEALPPGEYCVSVDFPEHGRLAKPVAGAWTYPKLDGGMGVGRITITLSEGEIKEDVNFGWDYLLQPFSPDPEPTLTPSPQPTCSNKATYIEDVTVSDGARFSQGEEFSKVWRLKNVGTCVWSTEYSLVFVSGDQMSGLAALLITEEVSPESEIDLGVSLKAPEKDGSYKGYWMLQSNSGDVFGIGKSADKPFWVRITVGKVVSRDSVVSWTYELNPENLANEGRWVDVDLGQQLLTAYEGSTPIMRFVVSTGTSAHPTVTGQFRIWVKLATTDMSGPGYSLEDVPYTMYFYQGFGLHGTYWHDNFGTPMSHGCVNLRTPDAGWLFDFVSEGTLVNVHL